MAGFEHVIAPLSADAFQRDYWLRSFVHIPGETGRFKDLLTWTELSAILEQHRLTPPRLKLYREGQPIDPALYLTPAIFGVPRLNAGGLAACLAQGASLILDDVQELAPRVQDLMHGFQDVLRTDAYANLYAGWKTQKALELHWDAQEAIIIQLNGRKRWKVYEPTRPHPLKNDIEVPAEPVGAPAWDGILTDGDTLYIPRGWWHEAFPLDEPSLHLTISLTPPTCLDYVGWVVSQLRSYSELRANLQARGQTATAKSITRLLIETLRGASIDDFLREWEANIRPSPRIRLPDMVYDQFSPLTDQSTIRLASSNKLSFSKQGNNFAFFSAGRLWTVPASLYPALAKLQNSRAVSVSELAANVSHPTAKTDLLKSLGVLAHAGIVVVEPGAPSTAL
jgi:ribosomal protein L16 Arg81 hydroxylase